MNRKSDKPASGKRRARWVAAGFVGAFAASVGTVIWSGLKVDGYVGEFQAGFRAVTLQSGESRNFDLAFDVPVTVADARLELTLPACLVPADGQGISRPVALAAGPNEMTIELTAAGECSGYMYARVIGDEPLDLERIFVTVEPR